MLVNHIDTLLFAASSRPGELTTAVERFKADNRAVEEAKTLVGILASAQVLPNGFGDSSGYLARIRQLEAEVYNLSNHPLIPPVGLDPLKTRIVKLTSDLAACNALLESEKLNKGEFTSPEVASLAAKILANRKSSKDAKRIAASVLTQAKNRK